MKFTRQLNRIVVLSLILALIPFGTFTLANNISPFSDVSDNHWALQHLLKLEMRGIVKGYENGEFRPNNIVSQLEATVMAIRAMGLEEDAKNADISILEGLDLNLPTGWNADGYVALALERNLISEDNFAPDLGASRAWVAQLIIKMIGAEEEVDANAQTSFYDDAEIPLLSKGYVALAAEKGIITGLYDSNGNLNFYPNQTVTRAEIATMISRSDQYMLDVAGQLPVGFVKTADTKQISLVDANGGNVTYSFAVNVAVFNQSEKRSTVSQLKPNDIIRFGLNKTGQVSFIETLDPPKQNTFKEIYGQVIQHYAEDKLVTIKDEKGKLYIYEYQADNSSIELYDNVKLLVTKNDIIVKFEATSSPQNTHFTKGKIYAIDNDTGIITLEQNGKYVAYNIADSIEVEYEGVRFATIKDLQKGDEVELILNEDDMVELVRVLTLDGIKENENTTSGTIINISLADRIVTIRNNGGTLNAFEVANDVVISIEGANNIKLDNLKVGDTVDYLIEDNLIVSMTVTNRSYVDEITGIVKSIDTKNLYLTIELANEELKTYYIDEDVELDLDQTNADLYDIEIDDRVTIYLDKDTIYAIVIDNAVEGEITQITDYFIVINTDESETFTFAYSDDVEIDILDNRDPDIDDLDTGDYVELIIDNDEVEAINVFTFKTSIITKIDKSDDEITIIDEDDDTTTYRIRTDTELIVLDDDTASLSDFDEGDAVELVFHGDYLDSVTLVEPVYGTIASISSTKLILDKFNREETFNIDDEEDLAYDDDLDEMDIDDLEVDDFVKVIDSDSDLIIIRAEKIEGKLNSIDVDDDKISFTDDSNKYRSFNLDKTVMAWKNDKEYDLDDLESAKEIIVYIINDLVAGIVVVE